MLSSKSSLEIGLSSTETMKSLASLSYLFIILYLLILWLLLFPELWLSFWSEVHYNSLYATGDVPTRVARKKHWLF
ncbi:hypothetical protein NC652_015474 [Populus alba x Populus x berolinensis]|nr:hypothetical protein NC652_015474 [Populus alba x Populus x berolinensis]